MKPTILIAAANGFIGRHLTDYLKDRYRIVALVRKNTVSVPGIETYIWDGRTAGQEWEKELEHALAVINLAGKSVNCRYNPKNKAAILRTRLETTSLIGNALTRCKNPPKVWLNAASATIYAHSEVTPNTENRHLIGEGFSVDVCRQWEECVDSFDVPHTRKILLRTAIVLGKNGGVMVPFRRLAQYGLGGKMGNGNQQFSWIHVLDFCRSVEFLIHQTTCHGAFNISSPQPVTNAQFMQLLRHQLAVPFGLPSPKWLLKCGAWLIGTETELILKSRYVLPQKLLDEGFEFRFPDVKTCLRDILR